MTTQPVVGLKAAVVAKLTTLAGTSAQVTYGTPTTAYLDDQIVVGDANVMVSFPTYNHQQHDVDLDLMFSSWRAGDTTQQQTASEAALALYELLVAYLRVTPTDPFGLASSGLTQVQRALCTDYTLQESNVEDGTLYGRLSTVTATLHVCIRPS